MDIVASIVTLVRLTDSVLNFCNESKELRNVYRETITTLVILKSICEKLNKKNVRLPKEVQMCFIDVSEEIKRFEKYLMSGVKANPVKRAWRVFRNEGRELAERIDFLTTNLKLLMDLKQVNDEDARFDASQVLMSGSDVFAPDDKVACHFWEKHFGSESASVAFSRCMQAFENEFQFNARTAQRSVMQEILDPDSDGNVTVYEFAKWLQRFGPLRVALKTTFDSILDTSTGDLFDFFFGDVFQEQAAAALRNAGPNQVLIRHSDIHEKCFSVMMTDANLEIWQMTLLRFGNRFILLSPQISPHKWIEKWVKKRNKQIAKRAGQQYRYLIPTETGVGQHQEEEEEGEKNKRFATPSSSQRSNSFTSIPDEVDPVEEVSVMKYLGHHASAGIGLVQQHRNVKKREDEQINTVGKTNKTYEDIIFQSLQILCLSRQKNSTSVEPRYNNLVELVKDIFHITRLRNEEGLAAAKTKVIDSKPVPLQIVPNKVEKKNPVISMPSPRREVQNLRISLGEVSLKEPLNQFKFPRLEEFIPKTDLTKENKKKISLSQDAFRQNDTLRTKNDGPLHLAAKIRTPTSMFESSLWNDNTFQQRGESNLFLKRHDTRRTTPSSVKRNQRQKKRFENNTIESEDDASTFNSMSFLKNDQFVPASPEPATLLLPTTVDKKEFVSDLKLHVSCESNITTEGSLTNKSENSNEDMKNESCIQEEESRPQSKQGEEECEETMSSTDNFSDSKIF